MLQLVVNDIFKSRYPRDVISAALPNRITGLCCRTAAVASHSRTTRPCANGTPKSGWPTISRKERPFRREYCSVFVGSLRIGRPHRMNGRDSEGNILIAVIAPATHYFDPAGTSNGRCQNRLIEKTLLEEFAGTPPHESALRLSGHAATPIIRSDRRREKCGCKNLRLARTRNSRSRRCCADCCAISAAETEGR